MDKESLIVRGWHRAGALAVLFDPANGSLQNANLAVPKVTYASDPDKGSQEADDDGKVGSKSKRPFQTITPLAERLGIKDKVNVKFAKGEEKQMVASVLAETGGRSHLLATRKDSRHRQAYRRVETADKPIPSKWSSNRFDVVWVFTPPAPSSGQMGLCSDAAAAPERRRQLNIGVRPSQAILPRLRST